MARYQKTISLCKLVLVTHAKAVQLVVYNSRLGGFTNWPIEKGGRGVQEGGWAGSCNMDNRKKDNIDSKKVASEIISELVGGI